MPFTVLDQMTHQPVQWLWPGRLARGHLHIVDGDPGLGKSLVLLDLAARLSTGRPWPDDALAHALALGPALAQPPAPAIIVNAEDGARESIAPRLAAAGADPSKILVWNRTPGDPWLRLPGQVSQLDNVLAETGAALLVLDPFMAFLDAGVNTLSDTSVRNALAPLADMAAHRRCAVVLIRHLSKTNRSRAIYRGLASIAFIAACRIAWLIGPDPNLPRHFVLAQAKNNLDPPQPSLSYTIESNPLPSPLWGEGSGVMGQQLEPAPSFSRDPERSAGERVARIRWLGPSPHAGTDLLTSEFSQSPAHTAACEFLAAFLKNGPQPRGAIRAAARNHHVHERTLRRAASALDVQYHRTGFGPRQVSYWYLKGQAIPHRLLPNPADDLEPWFRRMEEAHISAKLETDQVTVPDSQIPEGRREAAPLVGPTAETIK